MKDTPTSNDSNEESSPQKKIKLSLKKPSEKPAEATSELPAEPPIEELRKNKDSDAKLSFSKKLKVNAPGLKATAKEKPVASQQETTPLTSDKKIEKSEGNGSVLSSLKPKSKAKQETETPTREEQKKEQTAPSAKPQMSFKPKEPAKEEEAGVKTPSEPEPTDKDQSKEDKTVNIPPLPKPTSETNSDFKGNSPQAIIEGQNKSPAERVPKKKLNLKGPPPIKKEEKPSGDRKDPVKTSIETPEEEAPKFVEAPPPYKEERTNKQKKKNSLLLLLLFVLVIAGGYLFYTQYFNPEVEPTDSLSTQVVKTETLKESKPIFDVQAIESKSIVPKPEQTKQQIQISDVADVTNPAKAIVDSLEINMVKDSGSTQGIFISQTFYKIGDLITKNEELRLVEIEKSSKTLLFQDRKNNTWTKEY